MEIDAQVHYPLEEVRGLDPKLAAMSESDLKAVLADSLIEQVMAVAQEELQRHGQMPKAKITAAGQDWETGVEMMTNRLAGLTTHLRDT